MNNTIEVEKMPGAPVLNTRVFLASLSRAVTRPADSWKAVTYVRPRVMVDEKKIRRYAQACGYSDTSVVPLLLPHIEAFPLAMMLFSSDHFPFRAMGMVHLENRATLHQQINSGDELRVEVCTGDLLAHDKGQVIILHARALRDGVLVWDSSWTLLRPGIAGPSGPAYASALPDNLQLSYMADIKATAAATRRYAMVSGDVNPIHLSYVSARLMGFRGAIAHGMWTKARALALLGPAYAVDGCEVCVEFKSPLYLPATTALWVRQSELQTHFEVRNTNGDRIHMRGRAILKNSDRPR